ncbi:hypothetical protein O204_16620 [Pseudomonas simiae]|uniref:Uncharacterized protein n=1 Tax=Pseudomonas simiae TaxID=321846 RepID=U1TQW7_9PSED|nr:hypothetical protein O204_16620 [Pseudomonas simiae]
MQRVTFGSANSKQKRFSPQHGLRQQGLDLGDQDRVID